MVVVLLVVTLMMPAPLLPSNHLCHEILYFLSSDKFLISLFSFHPSQVSSLPQSRFREAAKNISLIFGNHWAVRYYAVSHLVAILGLSLSLEIKIWLSGRQDLQDAVNEFCMSSLLPPSILMSKPVRQARYKLELTLQRPCPEEAPACVPSFEE